MKRSVFLTTLIVTLLSACTATQYESFMLQSGLAATPIGSSFAKLRRAATSLTPEKEHQIGRIVAARLLGSYQMSNSRALTSYVNQVGQTLALFSDRPNLYRGYRFVVLDTPELNAVAAPSGFIFVTSGLLKQLKDEDALAAVLAHEIGHVVLGHGLTAISQANVLSALTPEIHAKIIVQGDPETEKKLNSYVADLDGLLEILVRRGYSRGQEYEADEYAIQLLTKSGYNPHAIEGVFDELERSRAGGESGGWLQTHPPPHDRKNEVEDLLGGVTIVDTFREVRASRYQKITRTLR